MTPEMVPMVICTGSVGFTLTCLLMARNQRLAMMSITPRMRFNRWSSATETKWMEAHDETIKVMRIGVSLYQSIFLQFLKATRMDPAMARMPDSVVASP